MAFLIGGANSAADTGFNVANSCRFNDGDASYMHKTPGSEGAREKWTFSCWIKKATNGIRQHIMTSYYNASNFCTINFESDDQLNFYDYNGGSVNGKRHTTRVFRDNSAWYNIVCVWDTTNGTTEDKIRIYVNGVRETVFDTNSAASDNDSRMNHTLPIRIGAYDASSYYFDGYISEVVFIDNLALDATSFGEFDDDSPRIWKPKDVSGLTFGTNGFYLDFEDSANLGNDANGGTDLTEVNLAAADQATDTPTNNFATANPLANLVGALTYSQGNLEVTGDSSGNHNWQSTIGLSSGKWYWEMKSTASSPDAAPLFYDQSIITGNTPGYGFNLLSRKKIINGSESGAAIGSTAQNDIHGVALDLDNGKLWIHRNGTYLSSGDPAGDSNPLIETSDGLPGEGVIAGFVYNGTVQINFGGCPAFAITSGNADDNGYGNFEYDVPANFYALCTKNLAEFGG